MTDVGSFILEAEEPAPGLTVALVVVLAVLGLCLGFWGAVVWAILALT